MHTLDPELLYQRIICVLETGSSSCFICKKLGEQFTHSFSNCPFVRNRCFKCMASGHISRQCPIRRIRFTDGYCHYCGLRGICPRNQVCSSVAKDCYIMACNVAYHLLRENRLQWSGGAMTQFNNQDMFVDWLGSTDPQCEEPNIAYFFLTLFGY